MVIKRGAAGALVQQRVDEAPLVVPGFPATVPDTVGAGDSFNAGFLYAVSEGRDAVTAAHFANGVAALVIRSQRGVLGGPTADEVNALLDTQ